MRSGKILVFNGANEKMKLIERELPPIGSEEILVKNLYTTICGSDLHTFCGLRHEKTPSVLGHEIVGEVIEIGTEHSNHDYIGNLLQKGDRVTWSIFSSDPLSMEAQRGMPQKSSGLFKYGHAQVTDNDAFHGGLADYCILKRNTAIIKVPSNIPLSVAATINCSVATVAGALRLAGDLKSKRVLITGLGLLGIVCVAMCKDAGAAKIFTADINAERLNQSLDFGADETYMFQQGNLEGDSALLNKYSNNIDVVFDMSGAAEAMEAGLVALGVGGIAIWIGAVFHSRNLKINAEQIVRKLITIKGLHNYNYEDLVYAVDFMERNYLHFPFEKIIGKEFSLAQGQKAFEYAVDHKPLRVGIRLNN
ncbi:zinc-binding dehydrogenase [Arcicella rosea]|uniref:Alcohol dehydrogenase n=1 Tax=Arcicella rosea TaxID=502909 RepID=A0A841EEH6_9BACT|nr:zinc-binding dehydrogenase [Arcicella rosea]MBB6002567.1 alcohol dehydrogenase [Arcicella rosea]